MDNQYGWHLLEWVSELNDPDSGPVITDAQPSLKIIVVEEFRGTKYSMVGCLGNMITHTIVDFQASQLYSVSLHTGIVQ